MMIVDMRLKEDVKAAKQKRASKKKSKSRKKTQAVNEDEEENGFHFIAYVPAHGSVWKMDGMEAQPENLGIIHSSAVSTLSHFEHT